MQLIPMRDDSYLIVELRGGAITIHDLKKGAVNVMRDELRPLIDLLEKIDEMPIQPIVYPDGRTAGYERVWNDDGN